MPEPFGPGILIFFTSLTLVIRSQVQDRVQYPAKDIETIPRSISIAHPAGVAILIPALEPLLEIVLILAPVDVRLITVDARPVHGRVIVTAAATVTSVHLTLLVSLLVAIIHGLPQQFGTPIIGVVVLAIP